MTTRVSKTNYNVVLAPNPGPLVAKTNYTVVFKTIPPGVRATKMNYAVVLQIDPPIRTKRPVNLVM